MTYVTNGASSQNDNFRLEQELLRFRVKLEERDFLQDHQLSGVLDHRNGHRIKLVAILLPHSEKNGFNKSEK